MSEQPGVVDAATEGFWLSAMATAVAVANTLQSTVQQVPVVSASQTFFSDVAVTAGGQEQS